MPLPPDGWVPASQAGVIEAPIPSSYFGFYENMEPPFLGAGTESIIFLSFGGTSVKIEKIGEDDEEELPYLLATLEFSSVFGTILIDTIMAQLPDTLPRLYISMLQLHTQKRSERIRGKEEVEKEENLNDDFDRRGGGIPNAETD